MQKTIIAGVTALTSVEAVQHVQMDSETTKGIIQLAIALINGLVLFFSHRKKKRKEKEAEENN